MGQGGIASLQDIEMTLKAGAKKVSMNSAAVKDPDLVTQAAKSFGKETVCIAIDGRRNPSLSSGYEVVVAGGTRGTGLDCGEWARRCQELGAGVVLPTSMDGDGTLAGYDLPECRTIRAPRARTCRSRTAGGFPCRP